MNSEKKYIIDSNAFIEPFQTYYPFDWAPNFWDCLKKGILSGRIILLDTVKNEIAKGEDLLQQWIEQFDSNLFKIENELIFEQYSEVLNHIKNSNYYKPNALILWSDTNVADGWIIATALAYKFTVVTFETKSGGLNPKNPCKSAKIPDVCENFSIKCIDLFKMMRELDFKL